MAFGELIKNFERIRDYMREFYVYGFKSRGDYDIGSARSYDNEKRRVESWLGDYMSFQHSSSGKAVFLSFDSRYTASNPLYKALKAKSFTDGDITLHFLLMDILQDPETALTVPEIADRIDRDYLAKAEVPVTFDESTIRKKVKEYEILGLLESEKQGRRTLYRRAKDVDLSNAFEMLSFFSEVAPLGVVGSFLLDKGKNSEVRFFFKHHDITGALESEVLYTLLQAMREKRTVSLTNYSRRAKEDKRWDVVPLRIFASVQSGRRYLMCRNLKFDKIVGYRLDYITSVKLGNPYPGFDEARKCLDILQEHTWGVVFSERQQKLEHVSFTLNIGEGEEHIWDRLEREKRCGTVTRIDNTGARFDADVYDASEMLPWIRTFICRISSLECSNKVTETRLMDDLALMNAMYCTEVDPDAVS